MDLGKTNKKTMENKQTAVEWLANQLSINDRARYNDVIEKAEQMEKEQIKEAFTDGCIGELYELNAYYTSEKYYEETYGTKKQDSEA
jgi:hypothetical protein